MADKKSRSDIAATPAQSLKATAYHEAGHAVMSIVLGRTIEKVTVSPAKLQSGGNRLGACKIQKGRTKASQDGLEDEVLILLAGMVAESHFTGRYCQAGAAQDLMAVRRLLSSRAPKEKQLERLAKRMLNKTEHVLDDEVNRKAIVMIAAELVDKETISGRAVRHLLDVAGT